MPTPRTALQNVALVMVQNIVYATPVKACKGYVSPESAALEQSISIEAADFESITVTDGVFETTAPFIRCTDAPGCTVQFKPLGA